MTLSRLRFSFVLLALPLHVLASTTATTQTSSTAGNLLQVLLGLVAVLGLMAAAAWMLRRLGLSKIASASAVKIIGGISVGSRERILVVEVADQWIVVGVAPGRVNTLSTLPRQDVAPAADATPVAKNFSAWLKQTIEKRNSNNVQ